MRVDPRWDHISVALTDNHSAIGELTPGGVHKIVVLSPNNNYITIL